MATTAFTSGPIGAGPTDRSTTPRFKLGTPALGDDNTNWTYVQATAAITGGADSVMTAGFTVAPGVGGRSSPTAFATGEYGWIKKTTSPL